MTRRRIVACLIAVSVAAFLSFESRIAFADSITPAKVQASWTLENTTGTNATDYHVTLERLPATDIIGNPVPNPPPPPPIKLGGGDGSGFFRGKFKAGDKNRDGTAKVTGDGTAKISIDLDGAMNSSKNVFGTFRVEILGTGNEMEITESYFTRDHTKIEPTLGLPGLKVRGDPEYVLINSFDFPMGIRDLQFLVNVAEIPLEALDPGSMPGFGPTIADFVLSPRSERTFFVPGDLAPGNFLYAQGLVFDSEFTEQTTAFIHGHQAAVPVPSTGILLLVGILGICGCCFLRRAC